MESFSDSDGASIRFSVDGEDQTGLVPIPNTGNFLDWTTITAGRDIPLNQGVQQVRIDIVGEAFTLDNFSISVTTALLGDVNQDGVVNFSDIPSMIQILISGAYLEEADVNEDGAVGFSDIPPFIAILQAAG